MQEILMQEFTDYMDKRVNGKDIEYFSNGIHCSSLDSCVKQVVLDYYDFPRKGRTLAENFMLDMGNAAHHILQDWALKTQGFNLIGNEIDLSDYLPANIVGRCDVLLEHNATKEIVLIDIKSVRPNAFKYGNLLKDSYVKQVNAYRLGIENMGKPVKHMYIFVVDRAGSNMPVILEVPRIDDDDMIDLMDTYITAVKMYESTKKLPSVLDKMLDKSKLWQCNYCSFYQISCGGAE